MVVKAVELAFHFVAVSGLVSIAKLVHDGRLLDALSAAAMVSLCIFLIAYSLSRAERLTRK
jgi:hypothetical protein